MNRRQAIKGALASIGAALVAGFTWNRERAEDPMSLDDKWLRWETYFDVIESSDPQYVVILCKRWGFTPANMDALRVHLLMLYGTANMAQINIALNILAEVQCDISAGITEAMPHRIAFSVQHERVTGGLHGAYMGYIDATGKYRELIS